MPCAAENAADQPCETLSTEARKAALWFQWPKQPVRLRPISVGFTPAICRQAKTAEAEI